MSYYGNHKWKMGQTAPLRLMIAVKHFPSQSKETHPPHWIIKRKNCASVAKRDERPIMRSARGTKKLLL